MTIPFKNIPANIRVPLFYAEVDPSQANTGTINQRGLIIAPLLAAGTATPGVPYISSGPAADALACGQSSVAALMSAAWRRADNFGELWILPLADDPSAVAATGNISFTGPATAAGTLSLYIGGVRIQQPVTVGMTANALVAALVTSINAINSIPVTASIDGSQAFKLDLVADNKGPTGNEIDLRLNYLGVRGGEQAPAGIVATITQMSGGATAPSLTIPLANLGDQPFDFIATAFTDATSIAATKALMNDTAGRWSWDRQVYGHVFYAYRGTLGALTTYGVTQNDQHASAMGFNDSPSPAWLWAADVAATSAVSLRVDPGVPLQTLALSTVLAPPLPSRFQLSDRNVLLFDGISTFTVDPDGTVRIENLITTYQLNAFGQPDNSYLEVETLFLLAFVLRFLKTRITSKYSRSKLAADGTRFAPGSNIVTPGIIKADLIAAYRELEFNGFVQKGDAFKASLIVQQNTTNPNRVDVLWPGTLIDQLRIFAVLAQFRLQ